MSWITHVGKQVGEIIDNSQTDSHSLYTKVYDTLYQLSHMRTAEKQAMLSEPQEMKLEMSGLFSAVIGGKKFQVGADGTYYDGAGNKIQNSLGHSTIHALFNWLAGA